MITVDAAMKIVTEAVKPLSPTIVNFEDGLGLCLAHDIQSDIDMPPFNRSAMDGYAVIAEDTANAPVELLIIENIAAGYAPVKRCSGAGIKNNDGAATPEGADAVVKFEETESLTPGNRVKILKLVKKGSNISNRGEDMRIGQTVLLKGTPIRPQEIGILGHGGKVPCRGLSGPNDRYHFYR